MNSSINFHGFVDLYQEENSQTGPGATTTNNTHHTSSHHPGVLTDFEPEGEQLFDHSCWSYSGK